MVFFEIKKKNIHLIKKNAAVQLRSFFCSEQFCIITFFRISYNLIGKWNLLTFFNF